MAEFFVASLGVFGIWETLLVILPWRVPAIAQPFLVAGLGYALAYPNWHDALGCIGAVLVLHLLVKDAVVEATTVRRPRRRSGLPPLP